MFFSACSCGVKVTESSSSNTSSSTPDTTPPTFTNHSFSVDETFTSSILVGSLSANDNKAIASFNIISGNIGNAFALSNSGELYTLSPLDYEAISNYSLIIKVSDAAGNFTTNTVNISVNDVALSLAITNQTLTLRERAPSNTLVGTIQVNNDAVNPSFTLTAGNANFNVDTNGVLRTLVTIDYEQTTNYNLTVRVTDADNNTTTATISVQVIDVLDEIVLSGTIPGRNRHYTGITYYNNGFLIYNYQTSYKYGLRFNSNMVFESNVFTNLLNRPDHLGFIEYLNESFYIIGVPNRKIFRISNGTVELTPLNFPVFGYGITTYSNSFYVTLDNKVYQTSLSGGSVATTTNNLNPENNNVYGIEYFNDSFYVVNNDTTRGKVYRYSTNFTFQESFTLDPGHTRPHDITYDPIHNSFWIINNQTKVFRYNTNFTREF